MLFLSPGPEIKPHPIGCLCVFSGCCCDLLVLVKHFVHGFISLPRPTATILQGGDFDWAFPRDAQTDSLGRVSCRWFDWCQVLFSFSHSRCRILRLRGTCIFPFDPYRLAHSNIFLCCPQIFKGWRSPLRSDGGRSWVPLPFGWRPSFLSPRRRTIQPESSFESRDAPPADEAMDVRMGIYRVWEHGDDGFEEAQSWKWKPKMAWKWEEHG